MHTAKALGKRWESAAPSALLQRPQRYSGATESSTRPLLPVGLSPQRETGIILYNRRFESQPAPVPVADASDDRSAAYQSLPPSQAM